MMRGKRVICIILCVILCFSLLACNNAENGVKYTVTFEVGADAEAAGVSVYPQEKTVVGGNALGELPVISGTYGKYTFGGWYGGDKQYTSTSKITSDVTLTAKWVAPEEVAGYDRDIDSWAQPGHLYIHYKRAAHDESEQSTPPASGVSDNAPLYSVASSSRVYRDWGLWCWPQNGEGRTFNPAWVDVSGAVYDVDLTLEYKDAGWDSSTTPGSPLGDNMTYVGAAQIGIQMFMISSRQEQGYWKNDGGNIYLTLSSIVRENGSYHWFITQGNANKGKSSYVVETIIDPYADIEEGSAITKKAGKGFINSNRVNPNYPQWSNRVEDFDSSTGYQIFIASFNDSDGDGMGDLRGIIEKLDYLDSLNIDVLWLTPFQTSTNYHGYDIDNYFEVDKRWGTEADYRELVYKAHEKGMKIVLDLVLNHTSDGNEWFTKSKNLVVEDNVSFADSEPTTVDYRQFYTWINQDQYNALSADAKKQYYGDEHGYYFYSSFGSSMPELNFDYQPVRDAILDVCYQWMAYGLDGFRIDAVKHIYMVNEVEGKGNVCSNSVLEDGLYSHDQARNYNFYLEFNYRLKSKYPNAFLVGENLDGWNLRTKDYYQGLDSQFDFNTYYAARGFAAIRGIGTNGSSTNASWMGRAFSTYKTGYDLFKSVNPNFVSGQFTSNHDLPRARNRMALSWTDGEVNDKYARIEGSVIDDSYYALYLYYGMIMTMPGVTWIYYGDEIGMEGIMEYTLGEGNGSTDSLSSPPHEDRTYRQPMKWEADTSMSYGIGYSTLKCELTGLNATPYVKSVAEQQSDPDSLWHWVQTLTSIRKSYKLGEATDIQGTTAGSKFQYRVACGNGNMIYVTVSADGSRGSGDLAYKEVTIGGTRCYVAVNSFDPA